TSFSIAGSPVINARPFAAFQITPPIGSTATTFTVDANPSTDLEGHTLLARWDWENDGTWDTVWSPTLNASHNYTGPGSKIIALELKDSLGATTKVTGSVEVGSTNTPPVPFFRVENGDRRFATTTPTFNFDATGSKDAETPTADLEYRWDFDGNGSWDFGWGSINKQAVTFSLNDQGKGDNLPRSNHWATKLQVRDSNGAVGETTRHIWANPYNHPPVSTGFL
ncbi:MAG: hypothetical protein GY796_04080, partial [Chloroflexi bacterium]|nr:hypothetical protein [Chloroflexota bacterium]